MLLFVYGTLKTGQRNHDAFLAGQTLLGPARTPPGYQLHDCGPYPALVECAEGVAVEGELWEVDDACLARIDWLEGVEVGLYRRVTLRLAEPAVEAEGYLFTGSVEGLPDCGPSWPA